MKKVVYIITETQMKKMMERKDNPCWDGYQMVGMKKKGGKYVPNCVPIEKK